MQDLEPCLSDVRRSFWSWQLKKRRWKSDYFFFPLPMLYSRKLVLLLTCTLGRKLWENFALCYLTVIWKRNINLRFSLCLSFNYLWTYLNIYLSSLMSIWSTEGDRVNWPVKLYLQMLCIGRAMQSSWVVCLSFPSTFCPPGSCCCLDLPSLPLSISSTISMCCLVLVHSHNGQGSLVLLIFPFPALWLYI